MNAKRKGTRNEHRSITLLEATGYRCTRAAASLGAWDIIGIGSTDVVLVQVKTRDWPGSAEMETLQDFPLSFPLPQAGASLAGSAADAGREGGRMTDWGIPSLRPDRLASGIPTCTYAGGVVDTPATTLFLWRSCATEKAQGGTLAFFLDDERLEALWKAPERYSEQFVRVGISAVVEVDHSLWVNDSLPVQLYNVYRTRSLSVLWQRRGIYVAPNLNWSDKRSFGFCFAGIPSDCPLAFTECRTSSASESDKKAFLHGLHEAVRQVRPRTLVIYGGRIHEWWIRRNLPAGSTQFVFLESWTDARRRVRAEQEREVRERNQLQLFGGKKWVEEEVQAA